MKSCLTGCGLNYHSPRHETREGETRTQADRQSVSTGMWRPSWKLVATPTLRIVGRPNYAQFGNRVHAGRVDVRAEADHANRADDLLMGRGGLERRDEPGGAVNGANPTA